MILRLKARVASLDKEETDTLKGLKLVAPVLLATKFSIGSNKAKDSIIDQQHAWINGSQRLSYMPSKSSINQMGPGEYEDSNRGEHSHSNWAKGDRFSQQKAFQN